MNGRSRSALWVTRILDVLLITLLLILGIIAAAWLWKDVVAAEPTITLNNVRTGP